MGTDFLWAPVWRFLLQNSGSAELLQLIQPAIVPRFLCQTGELGEDGKSHTLKSSQLGCFSCGTLFICKGQKSVFHNLTQKITESSQTPTIRETLLHDWPKEASTSQARTEVVQLPWGHNDYSESTHSLTSLAFKDLQKGRRNNQRIPPSLTFPIIDAQFLVCGQIHTTQDCP